MPYRALLDGFLRSVRGAEAALLLDATGEVVIESGACDDRHRLIGAYQGIALAAARRVLGRYLPAGIHYMLCRYAAAHVILRPLKDGYYLVVALRPDAPVAEGVHRSADVQERMNGEL
jgi:hypothetical protein